MYFCSNCGSPVRHAIPDGDNRMRHICTSDDCGIVHYTNPNIVAGCLIEHGDRLLLCQRAIEPRYGLWTLPAGFLFACTYRKHDSVLLAAIEHGLYGAMVFTIGLGMFFYHGAIR